MNSDFLGCPLTDLLKCPCLMVSSASRISPGLNIRREP
ncbi:uncharacterized protein METZ01_LOCUS452523, partial [marine metagenome]